MHPASIWTLFSVRELVALFFSFGTFVRSVSSSAAAQAAALFYLFFEFFFFFSNTNPVLPLETASAIGIRLFAFLSFSIRHIPPVLTLTYPTLRSLRVVSGLSSPLAFPILSHGYLCSSVIRLFSDCSNALRFRSSHRAQAVALVRGLRPSNRSYLLFIALSQILIFAYTFHAVSTRAETFKRLVHKTDQIVIAQSTSIARFVSKNDHLAIESGRQCLKIQTRSLARGELRELAAANEQNIVKLEIAIANRDQKLQQTEDDLDDKTLALERLQDATLDLQGEFEHYRYASEVDVQHWKDKHHHLERKLVDDKASFDRKITRISRRVGERDEERAAAAIAREARIAELERTLADTESDLATARSLDCENQAQVLSLTATLDFATAEHQCHMEHCERTRAAQRRQLLHVTEQRNSFVESLDFTTAEHRSHMDHCQRERVAARLEDLTVELSEERAARQELQQEYDGMTFRLATVSLAFAAEEAQRKDIMQQLDLLHHVRKAFEDALCTSHCASDAFIQGLQDDSRELSCRLSRVSKAYAAEERRRKQADIDFQQERQRHQLAVQSYRAGQQVSDAQIDHLMDEHKELASRLLVVGQAYATEEALRKEAQRQSQTVQQELEVERNRHRLARTSYLVGQRTSDTFIEHLSGISTSQDDMTHMKLESLMDVTLPEDFVVEGSSIDGDSLLEDSPITASRILTGDRTINTPSLVHFRSFSRSPSASPAPMTPGSAVLTRTAVFKKPELVVGDDQEGGTPDIGIIARRRLGL